MTSPWNKKALGAQTERSPSAGAITLQPNRAISGLRWWILALIFLVTCINYIDRSSVGLLVTHFGPEIGISGSQYGLIGALLLFAYTLSQSISGRLYDRYGARLGFTVSIIVWCAAAMAHSAIIGLTSFAVCSFFLGLGEAGNWPGAAKVVAEWFPQKERAIGMAVFNGGASMGGVIAPLLVGRLLDPLFGWKISFLIVGALGFIWLAAWPYRAQLLHSPLCFPCDRHGAFCSRASSSIPSGGSTCSGCLPISRRFAISA